MVLVEDNFHYMDKTERYEHGEYNSCETAIQECKRIVDAFLLDAHKPSMTARQLFELYTGFGDDPFIVSADARCSFSAWDYARERSAELCAEGEEKRSLDAQA
jgi:hypothetical protein